jgi:hypothetical protein
LRPNRISQPPVGDTIDPEIEDLVVRLAGSQSSHGVRRVLVCAATIGPRSSPANQRGLGD